MSPFGSVIIKIHSCKSNRTWVLLLPPPLSLRFVSIITIAMIIGSLLRLEVWTVPRARNIHLKAEFCLSLRMNDCYTCDRIDRSPCTVARRRLFDLSIDIISLSHRGCSDSFQIQNEWCTHVIIVLVVIIICTLYHTNKHISHRGRCRHNS